MLVIQIIFLFLFLVSLENKLHIHVLNWFFLVTDKQSKFKPLGDTNFVISFSGSVYARTFRINYFNIKILSFYLKVQIHILCQIGELSFKTPENDNFTRSYLKLFCLHDIYLHKKISVHFNSETVHSIKEDKWMNKMATEKKK